ncbi:MAG: tyrosine-type recombinase/integrase [Aureliella sp.]
MSGEKKLVKPCPEFPLTPTGHGYWKKIIRGTSYTFGERWCSAEDALKAYEKDREAIERGLPRESVVEPTSLKDALDMFLEAKLTLVPKKQLAMRTWKDYETECKHVIKILPARTQLHNLGPNHFQALLASYDGSPTTVTNHMIRAEVAFNWIEERFNTTLNKGGVFKKPSATAIRKHKAATAKGLIPPSQIMKLIEHAKNPQIKAMLWLAINCGFGNADVGQLPLETLLRRFKDGWIEYPRPKTGMARAAKLWPESVAALKEVIGRRQKGLVFLTKYGNPWSTDSKASAISSEVAKIRDKLIKEGHELNSRLNFYDCRRMFQTIAGNAGDESAVRFVMGHVAGKNDMSAIYNQGFLDTRLIRIADAVKEWLLGKDENVGSYFASK